MKPLFLFLMATFLLVVFHETSYADTYSSLRACRSVQEVLHASDIHLKLSGRNGNPVAVGEAISVQWTIPSLAESLCLSPAYLVFSTSARTRFEGQGFLAVPEGQPGPFDIQYEREKTRLFFPLHQLDHPAAEFKVKSFQAGNLEMVAALVTPHSRVAVPILKEDLVPGTETVSAIKKIHIAAYTVGKPSLIVRDNFTLQQAKKIIRANTGRFDIHIFNNFYRVLDARTGELLLERAGIDPNFSPDGRFVAAFIEKNNLIEIFDLYSQTLVFAGEAEFLGWGLGDTVFLPGAHAGRAGLPDTSLLVQQSLVDRSAKRFVDLYPRKTSTLEEIFINVDFDNGLAGARDTTGDVQSWASLIFDDKTSHRLEEQIRSTEAVCNGNDRYNRDCISAINEMTQTELDRLLAKSLTSARRLLRSHIGYDELSTSFSDSLPWYVNGTVVALSHHYPVANRTYLDNYLQHLNSSRIALRKNHRELNAKQHYDLYSQSAEKRGEVLRRTLNRDIGGTNSPLNRLALLSRVESSLGIQLSTHPNGYQHGIKEDYSSLPYEKFGEKAELIRSNILKYAPEASSLLPAYDNKKEYPCGSGDVHPDGLELFHTQSKVALTEGRRKAWLINYTCTTGASGQTWMYLLGSDPVDGAYLTDLAFEARYRVGTRLDGLDERGELEHASFVRPSSMGYGSWPGEIETVKIAFDKFLVSEGKWAGGRWALIYDLESRKIKTFLRNLEDAEDFGSLAISHNGNLLVQANKNNQLFFYDTATGEVLLRGVETDDELIVFDSNGHYISSPEGAWFLHLKFPGIPGYNSISQFASLLNRPEVVKNLVKGLPSKVIPKLIPPPQLLTTVKIQGQRATRQVTLNYKVSSDIELKELIVFVDGRPAERSPLTGMQMDGELSVNVPPEARWISAEASDVSGFRSIARGHQLAEPRRSEKSQLFAITVGTDLYDEPAIAQLSAAKLDAASFAKLVKNLDGNLYNTVNVTQYLDDRRLKTKLPQQIREVVAAARSQDTIMLFAAGHGVRGRDDKFYLVPRSAKLDSLEATAISWDEIAAAFSGVKARVFVFIDACHSGAAGMNGTNDNAVAALMSQEVPITVLAASKGRQYSEETKQGGRFTNEIARAVTSLRSSTDSNKNGAIELTELYGAIKSSVVSATGNRQTPWIARNQMVGEIPIF